MKIDLQKPQMSTGRDRDPAQQNPAAQCARFIRPLCVCYVGCCQQFGQKIAGCNLLFSRFLQERLFRRFAEAMLCG